MLGNMVIVEAENALIVLDIEVSHAAIGERVWLTSKHPAANTLVIVDGELP
jgi:hypothetical protein